MNKSGEPDDWAAMTKRFHLAVPDGEDLTLYGTLWMDGKKPVGLALVANRLGSIERGTLGALGQIVTLALQHGVPAKLIYDELMYVKFDPAGMTGDSEAPMVGSVVDWVARWMEQKCASGEAV